MDIQAQIEEVKKQYDATMRQREQAIQVKAESEARLNYLQGKLDLLTEMGKEDTPQEQENG